MIYSSSLFRTTDPKTGDFPFVAYFAELSPMRHLFLLISLATFLSQFASAAEIQWRSDLNQAVQEANQSGKLLLLHFYSDQCTWCERLEAGAFLDPHVQKTIAERFVPLKVHGPQNPNWVRECRVQNYPTDVIMTAKGEILMRQNSPQDPLQFVAMLEKPGRPAASLAAQPAVDSTMQANTAVQPSGQPAVPNLTAGLDPNIAADFPGTQTQPVGFGQNNFGLNPPANSAATTDPIVISPRENRVAENTRPQSSSAAISSSTNAGATVSSITAQAKQPMLDGFCPVTMIEEEDEAKAWTPGRRELAVVHLGEIYYFANEDAQAKFLANPERYAPILNGIDVVKFFDERRVVSGKRDYGWFEPICGRIFLFSSEESAERFNADFERYSRLSLDVMNRAMADYGR